MTAVGGDGECRRRGFVCVNGRRRDYLLFHCCAALCRMQKGGDEEILMSGGGMACDRSDGLLRTVRRRAVVGGSRAHLFCVFPSFVAQSSCEMLSYAFSLFSDILFPKYKYKYSNFDRFTRGIGSSIWK